MQSRFLTCLFFLLATATAFCQSKEFSLRRIVTASIEGDKVVLEVSTKGPVPSTVNDPKNWKIQATESGGDKRSLTIHSDEASCDCYDRTTNPGGTNVVTVKAPKDKFQPLTLDGASWNVEFSDGKYLLTASQPESSAGLKAAKGRDDADLYGAFSFLTGVGTSPIYTIDVKGGYSWETGKIPVLKSIITSPTGRTGFFVDVQTNTDTKAPVDRTEVDPDSIRAFWKIFGVTGFGAHKPYSLAWEIQPAGGEFSRSNPSSNFIGGGKGQLVIVPFSNIPFDFNPLLGTELGTNLNKPSTLFDQPVNLSNYDAIVRLLAGADSNFYIFRKPISDPDDPYRFSFSASYIARVPFAPEPFTRSEIVTDSTGKSSRQKVVQMRGNTRHYVTTTFNWNATKLLGLQLGYKYGSLPPLFELVDHQVTIGFVFKAKFTKWHSVPGA